jgi:hypothetical protein
VSGRADDNREIEKMNVKKQSAAVLLALASLALAVLSLAPVASAAPAYGLQLSHSPSSLSRSDFGYTYTVKVKNTSASTISCLKGVWTGTAPTFSYQWLRDGAPIAGATTSTYTPVAEDQNRSLQCQVTAANAGATTTQVAPPVFNGQARVPASPAPGSATVEAGRPTITGTTTLTCAPPTNWVGSPSWTYQWLRNGAPIAGATSQTYVPKSGVGQEDRTKVLQCLITGANVSGTAVGISSNKNIAPNPSQPPVNTAASSPITNGGEWISGATTVSLNFPSGLTFVEGAAKGDAWSCSIGAATCINSSPIAPGATLGALDLDVGITAETPDTVLVTAVALGGGSQDVAQDLFTLTPAIPFEFVAFRAVAIDEEAHDVVQAGAHPWSASAQVEFSRNSSGYTTEDVHEIWTDLPVGFVGNPLSVPVQCDVTRLEAEDCPRTSAAGFVQLRFKNEKNLSDIYNPEEGSPVFRLKAEKGYPAEFGFIFGGQTFVFRVKLRSDIDYGLTVIAPRTPQVGEVGPLSGARFTFCQSGIGGKQGNGFFIESRCLRSSDSGTNAQALLSNATRCAGAPPTTVSAADTWQTPGANLPSGRPDPGDPAWKVKSFISPAVTGCEKLTEAWVGNDRPTLTVQPDNSSADTPAGYTAHLHIPQDGLSDPDGLATAHLNNTIVELAKGPTLNPSVGDGISTCSEEQMGLIKTSPIRFDLDVPHCPDGAKLGNARIETPLLENPLRGSIYLAAQDENPFDSDYAIYLAIEEPDSGIVVKLAGEVKADPETGQLRTVFTENPELPFEDLVLEFFGGGRASLANPTSCGTFTTTTQLTPWSAKDPFNPLPSEIAVHQDPISITQGPNGSNCSNSNAERPFSLAIEAGSKSAVAGATSPFSMRITRPDGSQELSELTIKSPPGYAAYLRGVPACGEAQIAAARSRSGLAERESPSCPAASRLGSINSGAGAGPTPLFTPGDVYLGGPYKGAPLSLVTITPALAGGSHSDPAFDLGNVVVQVAIGVDRQSAQITAKTDPIPKILNGIPLRIRDIRVNLDRPDWGLNPTSCERTATTVIAQGSEGATQTVSTPFQVGGCENLGFKPTLSAKVIGGTKRGAHPAFTAELKIPADSKANIKDVQVALPHSEFLDQAHINTICTRVQAAAQQCPAGSIYGFAEAETPLLDGKLTGPVFLKSSVHKLPDLAIFLKGPDNQPVEVEFQGRIDSIKGQIRNTIEGLPDVPVSSFTLKMKGGRKGLLINSRDLCQGKPGKLTVRMVGHNNKSSEARPTLGNSCGGKGRKGNKAGKKAKGKKPAEGSRLGGLLALW